MNEADQHKLGFWKTLQTSSKTVKINLILLFFGFG